VTRPSEAIHDSAAVGFGRAGADYERGRPGYPPGAVQLLARELQIGPGRRVVDLAAGTGKLTRALKPYRASIVAVEPVAGMREQLVSAVPGIEPLDGTAERIPLPDASVDTVLVAQAFHWFDAPRAVVEIHRILRPGGGLGVIWNSWDSPSAGSPGCRSASTGTWVTPRSSAAALGGPNLRPAACSPRVPSR